MKNGKRLLIIDNSIDQTIYNPVEHWRQHADCPVDAVRPPVGEFPEQLDRWSHVIITGSEASILEDYDWIIEECRIVRQLADRQLPVLASCFGHQLVVRAISGKPNVGRCPAPEFGWVEVSGCGPHRSSDPIIGGLPEPFYVFSAHFDEVQPLPEDWERLGASRMCENAVVRWQEGPIWGVQHHPEIGIEQGAALMKTLLEKMPDRKEQVMAGFAPLRRDSLVTGTMVRCLLEI